MKVIDLLGAGLGCDWLGAYKRYERGRIFVITTHIAQIAGESYRLKDKKNAGISPPQAMIK